jgi:hypothetical protein
MSSSCSSFCNVFVTVSIIALMYIFWYVLFAVSGLQVEKDAESMKQHMLMRHTLLAILPEEALQMPMTQLFYVFGYRIHQ